MQSDYDGENLTRKRECEVSIDVPIPFHTNTSSHSLRSMFHQYLSHSLFYEIV